MNEDTRPPIAVIGMGRAGGSFAAALEAAGHTVRTYGRSDGWREATSDARLVLLCVPDREIAAVSAELTPNPQCVVGHVAGSLGLDVLAPHQRRVAIHPLMSLPDAELGAKRLRSAWFAVAGDPIGRELVASLGGRTFELDDDDRALYHATAAIASNHLVALLGQVERLSGQIGVPFQAFVDLERDTIIKPLDGMGGSEVFRVRHDDPNRNVIC